MKNKTAYLFLLPIIFCQLFSSCYTPRYAYSPSAHNVPVLTKKGDSKLAFNYSVNFADNRVKENVSTKGKARGYDVQAAYAFTNHWAMQVNYFHRKEKNAGDFDSNVLDSTVINYKRNLTEIGAGYFKTLGDNKKAAVQVFAGIGFGKFSFTDNGKDRSSVYRNRYHAMNITKIFLQPALQIKGKKNFAASLSSRFSTIFFKNITTDYSATELDNYKLDSLSYRPRFFWEPSIVNTFGFKKIPGVQLEFQTGMAVLMSRLFVDYRAFNFSAALLFDLPKLFTLSRHSSKN